MKKESLFQALEHIRLLCQVKGTLDINYVAALYEEIKDDFTDETILQAAREIVRTENTYGLFPSVKTWLEHSSKEKQKQLLTLSQGADFIQFIIEMIEMDSLYFDINIIKQDFKKKFGWHGYNALMKAGYKLSYIRNVGRSDNFTKQNILRECKNAWDKTDDTPLNPNKLLLENLKTDTEALPDNTERFGAPQSMKQIMSDLKNKENSLQQGGTNGEKPIQQSTNTLCVA